MLNDALVGLAQDTIPNEERKGRKVWITEEILDMKEEKRALKNRSEELYREA